MPGTYDFEDLILKLSTPFYICLIGLEIFLTYKTPHEELAKRPAYSFKDTFMNAVLMLLNGGIDLLFRAAYVSLLIWFYNFSFLKPIANAYWYWFALFLAEDLAFYTLHYVDHHCRLFWAVHVTHHSSERFNLTTGFRSSVFQPLYRFIYFIPLTLAGFNPADIIVMYSITQIYGIIVHTEYVGKMGWLEYIFVTPSHHRVHHASNIQYLDKNMGMCLIIWDRIFGTFQEELPTEPPRYGLTKPMAQRGLGQTVFHEWKAIGEDFSQPIDFKTKLKYLLKAPGWSPDGSRETSKDLQRRLAAAPPLTADRRPPTADRRSRNSCRWPIFELANITADYRRPTADYGICCRRRIRKLANKKIGGRSSVVGRQKTSLKRPNPRNFRPQNQ